MASKDQFAKDINFQKVVFLHVNRILNSVDNPTFMRQVKLYELVMSPYIDDDYIKSLNGHMEKITEVGMMDNAAKEKAVLMEGAKLELAEEKFSSLMDLAERKGLLLEKVDRDEVWELEDEEEEQNDTKMEE